MIRRPPRSTQSRSSAASDVYKRQEPDVPQQRGRHAGHGRGRRAVQPLAGRRSAMRAPASWVREYVAVPDGVTGREIGDALIRAGLEVEGVEPATEITGPLTVGR